MSSKTNIIKLIEKTLNEIPFVELIKKHAKWYVDKVENGAVIHLHILDKNGITNDVFHLRTDERGYINCKYVVETIITADRCAGEKIDFSKLSEKY